MHLRTTVSAFAMTAALCATGCGKIQSMLGRGDADGGSSGGLLSGLSKDDGLAFLSAFEGQIDIAVKGKMASKANPQSPDGMNLALMVKEKKFRVDLPAAPGPMGPMKGFAVVDAPQMKAFVVTDVPEKMALVFDLNKAGEQLKGGGRPSFAGAREPKEAVKPPKVTKTGKKDKVAGYECEDWEIQSDDSKVNVCVAQQGFSWLKIPLLGAPAEYAWMGELMDGTHFPLRAVMFERDGKEAGRLEVTKIEKKALAANLFEIPADHPQMTLEQMIGKAMAGMAGRMPPGAMPPGAIPLGAVPPGVIPPPAPKGAKTTKPTK